MLSREESKKETQRIPWHPSFAAALQLELQGYADVLDFNIEYQLTDEPLKIDVLIVKKTQPVAIEKNIGAIFAGHNIIEYKSPKDYLSIDDFYKVKAYTYLYKVLTGKVDEIKLNDLTMTLVSKNYPKKLMQHIKEERKKEVIEQYPGIYYIQDEDFPAQIIVQKYLPKEENRYLILLTDELKEQDLLRQMIQESANNQKNALYTILLDVIARANTKTFMEVLNMYNQMNPEEAKMLDHLAKKFHWDEKWLNEGEEKGVEKGVEKRNIEIAKMMLEKGLDIPLIMDITGLTREEIMKLK